MKFCLWKQIILILTSLFFPFFKCGGTGGVTNFKNFFHRNLLSHTYSPPPNLTHSPYPLQHPNNHLLIPPIHPVLSSTIALYRITRLPRQERLHLPSYQSPTTHHHYDPRSRPLPLHPCALYNSPPPLSLLPPNTHIHTYSHSYIHTHTHTLYPSNPIFRLPFIFPPFLLIKFLLPPTTPPVAQSEQSVAREITLVIFPLSSPSRVITRWSSGGEHCLTHLPYHRSRLLRFHGGSRI